VGSWIERYAIRVSAPNRALRHVMMCTARDVITELELSGASSGDEYLIRQRHASGGVGQIVDSGSWIGFRYHDAHWSFVKTVRKG
jgi:hypothetical protein